jgi:hypothetical protein
MATRSRIGIQLKNGSILSVYCHWDGYPEFNGVKLKEHYNTREKVAELIDGGDISSLWTNEGWDMSKNDEYRTLYYSERGEEVNVRHDDNLKNYLDDGEEYAYLFVNGEWKCWSVCGNIKEVDIPIPKQPTLEPVNF